jgi:hypothetical protein
MMAETALREILDDLRIAYDLERAAWYEHPITAGHEPSVEEARHALNTLHGFITRANEVVRDETSQWKAEFQSALQMIDDSAKSQPKVAQDTAVTVQIGNPERLASLPWELSINNGTPIKVEGLTSSFRRMPGSIIVEAKCQVLINGQAKSRTVSAGDNLKPGEPKLITLSLPAA